MTAAITHHPVAVSATSATPSGDTTSKHARPRPTTSTIEQAVALRDTLRVVAQQAGKLVLALKQQRRQARIVATTLASLKELHKVAA